MYPGTSLSSTTLPNPIAPTDPTTTVSTSTTLTSQASIANSIFSQAAQTSDQDHHCQIPQIMPTPESGSSQGLPDYTPMNEPSFVWGDRDSGSFMRDLDAAHKETVQWRNNVFKIPRGGAGKSFVKELSRLFNAFAEGSALEPVALKATIVLPLLMLQKPL